MSAVRDDLQLALRTAMRARDKGAVSALRTVLAALDNASAVPLETVGVAVGAGRGETARRSLTAADELAILRSEIQEMLDAAEVHAAHGRVEASDALRADAAFLDRFASAGFT